MQGLKKKNILFASLLTMMAICIVFILYFPNNDASVKPKGTMHAPLVNQMDDGKREHSIVEIDIIPKDNAQAVEEDVLYLEGDPFDDWHELQESLRESNDPNELIIAALYAQGSGAMGRQDLNLAETLLLRAYELDPDNILVNFQIHRFCISRKNYSVCGLPYVDNMARLGANNANVMMQVAASYYNNGDTNNAYLSMKQASESTTSDAFEMDYIEIVDKILVNLNGGEPRDFQDYYFHVGIAAALALPELQQNNNMCAERIQSQVVGWQEVCSQVGLRFTELDKSEFQQYFGYKMYYQYSGYTEEEVRKRLDAHLEPSTLRGKALYGKECFDEDSNPVIPDIVWREFIRLYREESEHAATVFMFDTLFPC